MTDIKIIKETIAMQYTFEDFLEAYNEASLESEKLLVLYQVIDYVDNCGISLDKIKQYLMLQPEKFEPFLSLILKINKKQKKSSTNEASFKNPVKVEVYTFME